ncbi:MAG: LLM class F420-dependent oxidoreductase, partial [Actinomycetota bacterium]|nr:LLM class F420-dependent oxidoreductase [Actinomycetota bacterium]
AAAGRDPTTLEISIYYAPPDPAVLANLAEHGIERVAFAVPSALRDEVLPVLDRYAEVMSSF